MFYQRDMGRATERDSTIALQARLIRTRPRGSYIRLLLRCHSYRHAVFNQGRLLDCADVASSLRVHNVRGTYSTVPFS